MTELKTLKDIRTSNMHLLREGHEELEFKELLRQEAIKWILDALNKRKNPFLAFKDFFNITDEELK
jgi:hypothetical protein